MIIHFTCTFYIQIWLSNYYSLEYLTFAWFYNDSVQFSSVIQSCPTLFDPWTAALQAPLSMNSPGKNTGMGSHFLIQGIFPTQGSNLGLSCIAGRFLTVWAIREAIYKRKNEILLFATTWVDLEVIMLSGVSQREKDKYCIISLTHKWV